MRSVLVSFLIANLIFTQVVCIPLAHAGKGMFDIDSAPTGATIKIDGRKVGKTPVLEEIAPGRYTISAEKELYLPETQTVDLAPDDITPVFFKLRKDPNGKLSVITTDMKGATVELDGQLSGKTPLTLTIPAGKHTVVIRHGKTTVRKTVEVTAGRTVKLEEPMTRTSLQVLTKPKGASVTLSGMGDHYTDTSPANFKSIKRGKYKLTVKKEYFASLNTNITVGKDPSSMNLSLDELKSHRKKRDEIINDFLSVKKKYDTASETANKEIEPLEAQLKKPVTSIPGMSKKRLLAGVPGKPFKKLPDKSGYYKTKFEGPFCIPCIPAMLVLSVAADIVGLPLYLLALIAGKMTTKDAIFPMTRDVLKHDVKTKKVFNEKKYKEDAAPIREYNNRLKAELNKLNKDIKAHNRRVDHKIEEANETINEHNIKVQESIDSVKSKYKLELDSYESRMDTLISKIKDNLKQIDIRLRLRVPGYTRFDRYEETFKEILYKDYRGVAHAIR